MDELLKWVPLAQVVTTAALTIVGICVAIASLIVAYRNNFGWASGILVMEAGLGTERAHPKHRRVSFEVQIWNRRKYPLACFIAK